MSQRCRLWMTLFSRLQPLGKLDLGFGQSVRKDNLAFSIFRPLKNHTHGCLRGVKAVYGLLPVVKLDASQ